MIFNVPATEIIHVTYVISQIKQSCNTLPMPGKVSNSLKIGDFSLKIGDLLVSSAVAGGDLRVCPSEQIDHMYSGEETIRTLDFMVNCSTTHQKLRLMES